MVATPEKMRDQKRESYVDVMNMSEKVPYFCIPPVRNKENQK